MAPLDVQRNNSRNYRHPQSAVDFLKAMAFYRGEATVTDCAPPQNIQTMVRLRLHSGKVAISFNFAGMLVANSLAASRSEETTASRGYCPNP